MFTWIAGAAILIAQAGDTAQDDAAAELTSMAAKIVQLKSYTFTSRTESDGGGFGGGGRGGGGPTEITGAWTKSEPMKLVMGETVAYKDGDQLVYKDDEGQWQLMESFGGGGGGRGGGEGRPDGSGDPGERPEGGGGGEGAGWGRGRGFGGMRGAWALSRTGAPHSLFAGFDAKVTEVQRTDATVEAAATEQAVATVVYKGKLTDDGARSLGGGGGRRVGFGGGGDGAEMRTTGTFEITVVAGMIHSAKFIVTRSGSFGERSFERTTTQTITFDKAGETEYEVPEEALARFEV